MKPPPKEFFLVRGKGIETPVWTSPARGFYWLLPGALVAKTAAQGMARYRSKVFQLRRDATRKGMVVDVGDFLLVTETLVFDSASAAISFVLAGSRSGDVARQKRKTLTGNELLPKAKPA